MILSRPETGHAFEQLIAALDAESGDLNRLGSQVAQNGDARKAAVILKLAGERARFRDHIKVLHTEWQQIEPQGLAPITTPDPMLPAPGTTVAIPTVKPAGPLLTIAAAARKVGVAPAKIREWLYAGKLAGQQGPTGQWKVSGPDLIRCYREQTR